MKKNKNLTLLLAMALTVALAVASCGAKMADSESGGGDMMYWGESNAAASPGAATDSVTGGWDYDVPAEEETAGAWDGAVESVGTAVKPQTSLAEKIIYSADVTVETVDFDGAVDSVERMLTKYGAFLESSSVSGKSLSEVYYGYQTYRTAYFVIRVPVASFRNMTEDMESVGSVLRSNVYTDNITERYYDTQSRADSYRIEQERLMAMLEKCETVADMIEIESRLSEVRYQLESLESTLRNWQNQVDYSTVTVTLNEVQEFTKQPEIHRTYWQQIGDGLKETLEDIGDFFKDLFKSLVVNLPTILLVAVFLAAAAAILAVLVRKSRARGAARRKAEDAQIEEDGKE